MCENNIVYITYEDAQKKIAQYKKNIDTYTVVLDGKKIKNWQDYITQIKKEFQFPYLDDQNYDGYADYLTDLDWIERQSYALFILDYDKFMEEDVVRKKLVMDIFLRQVLKWWAEDVEKYCVEGKSRKFNIYLVNDYNITHRLKR